MVRGFVKQNQSGLLVAGASVGVLATAYLTGKASFAAAWILHEDALDPDKPSPDTKEMVKRVWRLYIPAAGAGAATIVCVAGLKHVDGRRLLAAQGALEVSRRAFDSYREQVVETIGEKKDQIFAAQAVEKAVKATPQPAILVGSGTFLCYEAYTGRYFKCDKSTLDKAVNEINSRMIKHDYATLDDFYYEIGMENTMTSGQTGWKVDKLLELQYSSVLTREHEPCLAFEYNYVTSF